MRAATWCKEGASAKTGEGQLGVVIDELESGGKAWARLVLVSGETTGWIEADILIPAQGR